MQFKYKPVIVIVAFDRQKSLKRILSSLKQSYCPVETKLIISIDNNGTNQGVADIASEFVWEFGEKEVIYHNDRLGLRKHILLCGDLTYKYDSVIILEDDLYVSPHFYQYTQNALEYYDTSEKIAGISLYNLPYTESIKLPFIPVKDVSDVYFMQIPSSLGQAWSRQQWDGFKSWYEKSPDITRNLRLPFVARTKWPDSSWKKYFYSYIIETDKYFVYPLLSLTTNFNDIGTNMVSNSYKGQVEVMSSNLNSKFIKFEEAVNVYDAYSEILPEKLNKLCGTLKGYDYEVDIYGKKEMFNKEYVLTSKPCENPLLGFERAMKPHELNIIFNIKGSSIFLVRKEDILFYPGSVADLKNTNSIKDLIPEFSYYYTDIFDTDILFKILKFRMRNKIKRYFNR